MGASTVMFVRKACKRCLITNLAHELIFGPVCVVFFFSLSLSLSLSLVYSLFFFASAKANYTQEGWKLKHEHNLFNRPKLRSMTVLLVFPLFFSFSPKGVY